MIQTRHAHVWCKHVQSLHKIKLQSTSAFKAWFFLQWNFRNIATVFATDTTALAMFHADVTACMHIAVMESGRFVTKVAQQTLSLTLGSFAVVFHFFANMSKQASSVQIQYCNTWTAISPCSPWFLKVIINISCRTTVNWLVECHWFPLPFQKQWYWRLLLLCSYPLEMTAVSLLCQKCLLSHGTWQTYAFVLLAHFHVDNMHHHTTHTGRAWTDCYRSELICKRSVFGVSVCDIRSVSISQLKESYKSLLAFTTE